MKNAIKDKTRIREFWQFEVSRNISMYISHNLSNHNDFASVKWGLSLCIIFFERKSGIFANFLYKMNWELWANDITNIPNPCVHIHIDFPQNIFWKSAKFRNLITSLFFVQFSSKFHHSVRILSLFIDINLNLDYLWPLT